MKVRSKSSMHFGENPGSDVENNNQDESGQADSDIPSLFVQNMDLRVNQGDLTLNVLPFPILTNSDNSLLLAAENNLVLPSSLDSLTHSRKIMYGRNLAVGSIDQDEELSLGSTVSLDAISVFMDDLSPTLSPSVIQALAADNPDFEGFDSKGGLVELSQMSETQLNTLFKYGLFTGYSYFFQAPDKSAKLANDLEEAGEFCSLGKFCGLSKCGW